MVVGNLKKIEGNLIATSRSILHVNKCHVVFDTCKFIGEKILIQSLEKYKVFYFEISPKSKKREKLKLF